MIGIAKGSDANYLLRTKVGAIAPSIIMNTDRVLDDAVIIAQYVATIEVFVRHSCR